MAVGADFSLGTVDVALTPAQRFAEFLQARGKRVTRQRQVIVDHVASRHEHFDAEQLLDDLRRTPEGARARGRRAGLGHRLAHARGPRGAPGGPPPLRR